MGTNARVGIDFYRDQTVNVALIGTHQTITGVVTALDAYGMYVEANPSTLATVNSTGRLFLPWGSILQVALSNQGDAGQAIRSA